MMLAVMLSSHSLALNVCECNTSANRDILLQVQRETGGNEWIPSARFNSNHSVCSWYGVTCTAELVTSWIVSTDIGMTSLPPTLSNLSSLQTLVIQQQSLMSGTIPISWRNFLSIQFLTIAMCNVSGLLTDWIGDKLTTLQSLQLTGLALKGSLPASFVNLSNLTNLALQGCQFTGSIPDEWSSFKSIQTIHLHSNNLSGTFPSWIAQLPRLQKLSIGNNKIGGTFPSDINLNGVLEAVSARNTSMSGVVPSALVSTSIQLLDLANCYFFGPLPVARNQTSMVALTLDGNDFSGTLPETWSQMIHLTIFNISNQMGRGLCGGVPSLWSNVRALANSTGFDASINNSCPTATPTISPSLCPCDSDEFRLPVLALYGATNGPTSWYPYFQLIETQSLCDWSGVTCRPAQGPGIGGFALSLRFISVGMNGTLSPSFAQIGGGVESLAIYSEDGLFGTIPDSWSQLIELRTFTLSGVPLLSGSIPTWSWTHLQQLQLQAMPLFSGTIPDILGLFLNLSYIGLTNCNFMGTIPSALQNLRKLTVLLLFSNQLITGTIPSGVWQLPRLAVISFSNTGISGTLPRWIYSATSLTNIVGFNTSISGTLPPRLPPSLVVIQLGYSLIEGTLPGAWPITNPLLRRIFLFQENGKAPHLCGGIPESWQLRSNISRFWFNVNETLLGQRCINTYKSTTYSSTPSGTDCEDSMDVSVVQPSFNCSLADYTLCVWLAPFHDVRVSQGIIYVGLAVAYDTVASNTATTLNVALSTLLPSSAGGASWPARNLVSGSFLGAKVFPDLAQTQLTFISPSGGWEIMRTPYIEQTFRVGNVSFYCAARENVVVFDVTLTPRSLPAIASAVASTSTAASWGSAISGSGSTASATARVAAVQKLLLCVDEDSGAGGGLLGVSVGHDRLSSARGAISGNLLCVVASLTAIHAVGWVLSVFGRCSVGKMLDRMHGPSLMFPILAATLPSSIAATIRIFVVSANRDALAWLLAILGLALWGLVPLTLVWLHQSFRGVIQTSSLHKQSHHLTSNPLTNVFRRHSFWVSVAPNSSPTQLNSYHVLLREYRTVWYAATELLLSALSGAATAATAGSSDEMCKNMSIVLLVAYVAHLIVTFALAPFTTHFGMVYATFVTALSAMCVGFQIQFSSNRDAVWALTASAATAMIVLGVSIARTILDAAALIRGIVLLLHSIVEERDQVQSDVTLITACESNPVPEISFLGMSLELMTSATSHLHGGSSPVSQLELSALESEFWDTNGNARVITLPNASLNSECAVEHFPLPSAHPRASF